MTHTGRYGIMPMVDDACVRAQMGRAWRYERAGLVPGLGVKGMLDRFEAAAAGRRVARRGVNMDARPQPAVEIGADCLPQIEHIVILMMENHSYDNYLGMLEGRGDGLPRDAQGVPSSMNLAGDGTVIRMRHFPGTRQKGGVPTQSWNATHIQWDEASCDGFVRSIERTLPGMDASVAMTYWDEKDLPFYYGLAKTFPLATRWFSSCLGPTFPNRRFLISGTAHGLIDDLPFGMVDYPPPARSLTCSPRTASAG